MEGVCDDDKITNALFPNNIRHIKKSHALVHGGIMPVLPVNFKKRETDKAAFSCFGLFNGRIALIGRKAEIFYMGFIYILITFKHCTMHFGKI